MKSTELKIKHLTLCAEAKLIRREERRALKSGRWLIAHQRDADEAYTRYDSLYRHRVDVVRTHARTCHLTRAYMAGTPYLTVENKTRFTKAQQRNVAKAVHTLALRFGKMGTPEEVESWMGLD